eukprot:TRINITY_DN2995_c0_g1_i1.p1 TRINITY_DN2995_c0_g1~~TRINITY_DN2995_c0_g1_i1.p1  ORF type:complete len:1046 (+),score=258.08 TRINITY_DN2995_c0_g1_i1:52-3189(+)
MSTDPNNSYDKNIDHEIDSLHLEYDSDSEKSIDIESLDVMTQTLKESMSDIVIPKESVVYSDEEDDDDEDDKNDSKTGNGEDRKRKRKTEIFDALLGDAMESFQEQETQDQTSARKISTWNIPKPSTARSRLDLIGFKASKPGDMKSSDIPEEDETGNSTGCSISNISEEKHRSSTDSGEGTSTEDESENPSSNGVRLTNNNDDKSNSTSSFKTGKNSKRMPQVWNISTLPFNESSKPIDTPISNSNNTSNNNNYINNNNNNNTTPPRQGNWLNKSRSQVTLRVNMVNGLDSPSPSSFTSRSEPTSSRSDLTSYSKLSQSSRGSERFLARSPTERLPSRATVEDDMFRRNRNVTQSDNTSTRVQFDVPTDRRKLTSSQSQPSSTTTSQVSSPEFLSPRGFEIGGSRNRSIVRSRTENFTPRSETSEASPPTDLQSSPNLDNTQSQQSLEVTSSSSSSSSTTSLKPEDPSHKYGNEEPVIYDGELKVNRKVKWVKLTFYKLDLWRDSTNLRVPPQERISLGFKNVSTKDGKIYIIDELRGSDVVLEPHPNTEKSLDAWYTSIMSVIDLFRGKEINEFRVRTWVVRKLKLFIGSWNVGNAVPPNDLGPWLPNDGYDLIAVGAQECKYPPRVGQSSISEDWFSRVIAAVGQKYFAIAKESLWEIRNIILVKKELLGFVHSIETSTVARGIANTLGNKGGVGIRFCLYDTKFCFINSHLAAHIERVADRNTDYLQIIAQMKFPQHGRADVNLLNDCNYCFFYGDLNYRIDQPRPTVIQWIDENDYAKLQEADQLQQEQNEGRTFMGWTEKRPTFRPTYRYSRDVVDSVTQKRIYSEEKMRVPSWCDRVLWRAHDGCNIDIMDYQCCDQILTSDHSPVFATFSIDCRLHHTALKAMRIYDLPNTNGKRPTLNMKDLSVVFLLSSQRVPNLYLKFAGQYLEHPKKARTTVEKQTAAAHWDKTYSFPLNVYEKEYIQCQQLIFIVMDDIDYGNNVPLGQAVLSLVNACADQPVRFETKIIANGKEAGDISGEIHITDLITMKSYLDRLPNKS